MRISDWSSDVCSSDLLVLSAGGVLAALIAAFGSREGVWHFSDGFLILRWAFYAAVAGGLLAIVAWAMTRRAPGSIRRRSSTNSLNPCPAASRAADRKSTRLNSSH